MSKFIRDNQLEKYSREEDAIVRPIRKRKKVKKFKDFEEVKNESNNKKD